MSVAQDHVTFGELLRGFRTGRRLSQASLAEDAEVSTRHLSFLETGRAQPSREMVLVLGSALDLPLRERNLLLRAAGFAAAYADEGLDSARMAAVRRSLSFLLDRMAPNGVAIVDRHWNLIDVNTPMKAVLAWLLAPRPVPERLNLVRATFDPSGYRPYIANFDQIAPGFVIALERAALTDPVARDLLDEVRSFGPVPRRPVLADGPLIPLVVTKDGVTLSFFSTIAVLSTALDVTLDDLRIESYFPADEATSQMLAHLIGT